MNTIAFQHIRNGNHRGWRPGSTAGPLGLRHLRLELDWKRIADIC